MIALRRRLWLGFGGLLLILLVVSTLSVVVFTRYSHALERVFRENYDSAVYCNAMKDALDRLDLAAQRRVWGAPAPAVGADDVPLKRFDENLHRQLNNCSLPGEKEATVSLADEWAAYVRVYREFDAAPDPAAAYRQDLLPRHERLKQLAQRIADMNMDNMVSVDGKAKQTLVSVRNWLLVLVTAGVALAAILVTTIGATLRKPLNTLTRCAHQISDGNLDLSVEVHATDEIGQLAEAFNVMAARLREFRKLDHERLVRTQQTTQLAIDSLPDAVFVIGPAGRVEIANRTARVHFHVEPGALVGSLGLCWLDALYAQVLAERRPFEPQGYSSAIQLFDEGRERFLLPRAVPMLGEGGHVIGVTVILVDVTRLRQADESKSGLLSAVSHELRTPLTSIRMALMLLGGEKIGGLNAGQAKLLTAARQDSDRLHGIIENLLNLARLEAGRTGLQPRPMPPREIVNQALDPLRAEIGEKGLRLEVDVQPDLPKVLADPTCVSYALGNLLSNAMKFTPRGGCVGVRVEPEDQWIRFVVTDTGPGIPEEHARRVFDKFFRVPHGASAAGAGLGLAIAKEIVEAHHGHIGYRPSDPDGSAFFFTLPVATPVRTTSPASASAI